MQSELKPCPFCGWATGLSVFDSGEPPYWVECPDCCAQGAPEETKAEAITAWNTRASDAEITRLTEALRAAKEREKGLREGLTLAANRMDVMALAVSHENNARRYEWHEWAVAARAALKGPSYD